jgi:hypothetical protein
MQRVGPPRVGEHPRKLLLLLEELVRVTVDYLSSNYGKCRQWRCAEAATRRLIVLIVLVVAAARRVPCDRPPASPIPYWCFYVLTAMFAV